MVNIEYFANKVKAERAGQTGSTGQTARFVYRGQGVTRDVGLGIILEFLTTSGQDAYSVIKTTLGPHTAFPLHSHGDNESFYLLSGEVRLLSQTKHGLEWKTLRQGDFVDIPGGARHAWRNPHFDWAEGIVTTTPKLGQFLRETGGFMRISDGTYAEKLKALSDRYGYWLANPMENAAVGIALADWTDAEDDVPREIAIG